MTVNKQKFLELLKKRQETNNVAPTIVKPDEIDLTTDRNSPIVLQALDLSKQYPSYKVFSCLELNDKRHWLLILNEGSTK